MTREEKIKISEIALKNVEGSNITLWDVPDNEDSREYWKETWLSGFDKCEASMQKEIDELKEETEKTKEYYLDYAHSRDSYILREEQYLEEIESLKGKLKQIKDEIGKASLPEYGDCKITAKSIGIITGLTL